MRADNAHHIISAAHERSRATRRRAVAALRRMDTNGTAITFDTVAREARVSRSWLYSQLDLRTEVNRLRQRRPATNARTPPERQRATDASLRARLDIASTRIQQLESDNRHLRVALAEALGEQRAEAARAPRHDTPR